MEDGDSAHSEHTHRSSNNAGHDFVHGTWTVQFLRKPLPNPSPKREGLFGFYRMTSSAQKKEQRYFTHPCSLNYFNINNYI